MSLLATIATIDLVVSGETIPNLNRSFYLPRLHRVFYRAAAVVHWELTIAHRTAGWLNDSFHAHFRELLLHTCVRQHLLCPVYCLMPDHMHLVLMGLKLDSDQIVGIAFLRTHLKKGLCSARLQHQAYDHVLRDDERLRNAFARTCGYILDNPIRAELVQRPEQWAYSGAIVPGYPTLHPLESDFWKKFWSVYLKAKDPATATVRLPPRNAGASNPNP